MGMLKVNVDGASFGNSGPAGYDCVLQDSDGQILWVKASPIEVQNVTFAELIGMLEGMRF